MTISAQQTSFETRTIKEIKFLQQVNAHIRNLTLIKVQDHPYPRFEVHFTLHIQEQTIQAILITTRNHPYRLANLDRGIKFLQTLFLGVNVIKVKL